MNALVLAMLLTDFSADLPKDDSNATVSLRFVGIRDEAGNVIVQLHRRDGQWASAGHSAAADYNQKSPNAVQLGEIQGAADQLSGSLTVIINGDSPRPNAKGVPHPADKFAIHFAVQRQRGQFAPYLPDTLAFMPPWRKDEPAFGGELLTGTYTARRGELITTGAVQGAISPAPVTGAFGGEGNIVFGPAPGGGVKVLARLSPTRVAPPSGARIIKSLARPVAMGPEGLQLTISSEKRRDEVAVMLAVKLTGAGWRSVNSAGLLLGREETFPVKFDSGGMIEAVAIGVDSPHGVGDVEFVVRKIEVSPLRDELKAVPAPVEVRVHSLLDFAGTTEVPKGLFGFHDVNPPGKTDEAGLQFLRDTRPGLLRPLEHTGFGGGSASDEELKAQLAAKTPAQASPRAEAADAVDLIIQTHSQDLWNRPSWMDVGISNASASVATFYRNLAARSWTPGDDANTLRKFEIWNEPFMWGRHINMGGFNPAGKRDWQDSTQYGYIPGKLGADVWVAFFRAVASAKAINPHIQLGGPSAPAFSDDDYGVWQNYVARIVDQVGDQLDFLTEHHYGGNPRVYAASYEVAAAYCERQVGRRIPVYNTEANDLGASSAGKAAYNIADILVGLRTCPDIVKGRSLHALWSNKLRDEGEEHAYRLLAPLRGRLLEVQASDPGILVAGAVTTNQEIVVVALNTGGTPRELVIAGPVREARLLLADSAGVELQLRDTEGQLVPAPAAGKTQLVDVEGKAAERLTLPARSAVRWTLPGRSLPTVRRDRYFSDIVLQPVRPTETVTGKLRGEVPTAKLQRAILRVITRDVHEGEAVVLLNGHEIALPESSSNGGSAVAQDIAIEPGWLGAENRLEFRCKSPDRANGFTVYAACVLVDTPR